MRSKQIEQYEWQTAKERFPTLSRAVALEYFETPQAHGRHPDNWWGVW